MKFYLFVHIFKQSWIPRETVHYYIYKIMKNLLIIIFFSERTDLHYILKFTFEKYIWNNGK